MNKKSRSKPALFCLLLSGFLFATAQASETWTHGRSSILVIPYEGGRLYTNLETRQSTCRRYTVVWSGGVASRGPDRIRPRPIRTRWQDSPHEKILCEERYSSGRRLVADQPWIR